MHGTEQTEADIKHFYWVMQLVTTVLLTKSNVTDQEQSVTADKPEMIHSRLVDKRDLQACWDIQRQDLPNEPDTGPPPRGGFSVYTTNVVHSYTIM